MILSLRLDGALCRVGRRVPKRRHRRMAGFVLEEGCELVSSSLLLFCLLMMLWSLANIASVLSSPA